MLHYAPTGSYNSETTTDSTSSQGPTDTDECWSQVKDRLRGEVGEPIYNNWFASMQLERIEAETVRLSVPTKFIKRWITMHYDKQLFGCWKHVKPELRWINLSVRSALRTMAPPAAPAPSEPDEQKVKSQPALDPRSDPKPEPNNGGPPLDPRFTFESFVVGRSNTLAHAACQQVAMARRSDVVMFNPLYIHGGVGLGKTHLLQAATLKINASAERNAHYLTADQFSNALLVPCRKKSMRKAIPDEVDVLVFDDLQFLQGKHSLAEFSHTLNSLLDSGRQAVVAADRPPSELEWLDERVRSRLAGGLAVEIGLLGEELRLEILCARVNAAHTHHPGFDVPPPVLTYIARAVAHNGRDLEGALNRLLAHSKLSSRPITMELAESELRDMIRTSEIKRPRIEEIQRVVSRHFNVSRSDLLSARRTANLVRPRQIAVYLSRTMTLRSLPEIGRRFGGRDHTTMMASIRKIETLKKSDPAIVSVLEALVEEIVNA